MKLLAGLFGKPAAPRARPAPADREAAQSQFAGSSTANRRELLRVVLRETLRRHGIPDAWIAGETLAALTRSREPGVYWRLSIREWDERLPNHSIALQNALVQRLQAFDPTAQNWLLGVFWQYAIDDISLCPALPQPGTWTAARPQPKPEASSVDIGELIAGPVKIDSPSADVKADLERLMATLDAQYAAAAPGQTDEPPHYASTEPARL